MTIVKTRDGTEIYVKNWGEGRPVILLHGWPLSADMWDVQAMALAENGFRAISYDRRGFGRSSQPWSGYDYNTLTDDLADVMHAVDAKENVSLIGFSMGGGEVARYMSRYNGKGVVSAGLISSIVPFRLKTPDNPNGTEEEKFKETGEAIKKDRANFFRQKFIPKFFGVGTLSHPVSDELLDITGVIAMQASLKATLECAKSLSTTDFRPDLAHFKVPTLIIHGTEDKTVPIESSARAAAKGISKAQLIEYDGEPHGLNVTSSDRFTADLLKFLKQS